MTLAPRAPLGPTRPSLVQENVSGVVVLSTSSSLSHNGLTMLATGNLYVHAARSRPVPTAPFNKSPQLHPRAWAPCYAASRSPRFPLGPLPRPVTQEGVPQLSYPLPLPLSRCFAPQTPADDPHLSVHV